MNNITEVLNTYKMPPILKVDNLSKNYGKFRAVQEVSFEVNKGEVFALIGPNGAGKSTTLRIIATILTLSSGSVRVGDFDLEKNPEKVREIISYLPEEAGAYKNLTGKAYLEFMASLFTDNKKDFAKQLDFAMEITKLGDRLKEKVKTYSKGMTRKLLLARTVMTRPTLAILDEPTSGLDVNNALEIRRIIKELASEGMAVLLSSHNMLEIEFLSDRMAIIDQGRIHETGTAKTLKEKYHANNLEEVFFKVAVEGKGL